MSECFLEAVEKRRSIYGLESHIPLNDDSLVRKIQAVLQNAPTAFNSQSGRIVLLLGENHLRLWQIVFDTLLKSLPADKIVPVKEKIASFAAGYGTILYFEDDKITSNLQQKFPLYAENFPRWAQQSNGMLQYMIWTMLAENKIGASLQHYNPLIDAKVKQVWNLPHTWQLIAQMPFGAIQTPPSEKTSLPVEEKLKIFY